MSELHGIESSGFSLKAIYLSGLYTSTETLTSSAFSYLLCHVVMLLQIFECIYEKREVFIQAWIQSSHSPSHFVIFTLLNDSPPLQHDYLQAHKDSRVNRRAEREAAVGEALQAEKVAQHRKCWLSLSIQHVNPSHLRVEPRPDDVSLCKISSVHVIYYGT